MIVRARSSAVKRAVVSAVDRRDPPAVTIPPHRQRTRDHAYQPRARIWWRYHNHMALKKTTVMVDEEDLALIKAAAEREGRPESEYFREAFHLAALRTRRWDEEWDIPRLDFGGPVTAEEIDRAVSDGVADAE
jgi:predicted DNA binding CopG/RHH family protein